MATEKMARYLAQKHPDDSAADRPQEIWHSDKLRARQTAEIVATAMGLREDLAEKDFLAPLEDVKLTEKALAKVERPLLIVGHLPHLARLASLLLSGQAEPEMIRFETSGMVSLERSGDPIGWELLWALSPEGL
jgi:phosphohistidine phosphatase